MNEEPKLNESSQRLADAASQLFSFIHENDEMQLKNPPSIIKMRSIVVGIVNGTSEDEDQGDLRQVLGWSLMRMIADGKSDEIRAIADTVDAAHRGPKRGWLVRQAIHETRHELGEGITQADVRNRHGGRNGLPRRDANSEWRKAFIESGVELPKGKAGPPSKGG